jgi:tetratricopeptide (TPR) repeat protein
VNLDPAIYGPALGALVAGLGAGAWLARAMPSSEAEGEKVLREGRIDDLSGTHEDAVSALRALEQEQHKLPDTEYHRQRKELLGRGADALRELDEGVTIRDPLAERVEALEAQREALGDAAVDAALAALRGEQTPVRGSSAVTGALWTLALLAVGGGLWWQLSGDATLRAEGGSMTGNAATASAPPPAPRPDHPDKARWQAALDADPADVMALNGLTEVAIAERDLPLAMELSGRALEVDPANLDARTHRAVLQAAVGMGDKAFEELAAVRASAPDYSKAWVYTGLLALDQNRLPLAIEALSRAIELEPERADFLAARLRAAKAQASATSEVLVSGRIEAPGLSPSGTEILFVSLREPGGGPPLAALRLPPAVPTDFAVTRADLIAMGGAPRPVPPQVVLTVRLDGDGNPMTRDGPASEPVTVASGTEGLQVTLVAP